MIRQGPTYRVPMPEGVKVLPFGAPLPAPRTAPRNMLERAALCPDADKAAKMIQDALGITDGDLAALYLSDPERWRRIAPFSRLMEIGKWLRAEAYQCMDLVTVEDPLATVGTND